MDLLRSFLFVPADSSQKLIKARNCRADAVIYDLEDAVATERKTEARTMLDAELRTATQHSLPRFVRVNHCRGNEFGEDLRVAVRREILAIVLPKCHGREEVSFAHDRILVLEKAAGLPEHSVKLMPILESARGVLHAAEVAGSNARIFALSFGGEDYCADMRITRTSAGDELAFARSTVALAARSEGLEAIDGVFPDLHDDAGLSAETRRSQQMGFSGKMLVHPNQIDTVHRALAPSPEQTAWAQEVIRVFDAARGGVVTVQGKMIDEAVVLQASRILQRSRTGAAESTSALVP